MPLGEPKTNVYNAISLRPAYYRAYRLCALCLLIAVLMIGGIKTAFPVLLCLMLIERTAALTSFIKRSRKEINQIPAERIIRKEHKVGYILLIWITAAVLCAAMRFFPWGNQVLIILSLLVYPADVFFMYVFCPFRAFILHNKCCATCRIYHWNFLMLVTAIAFLPQIGSWRIGLCVLEIADTLLSVLLMIFYERAFYKKSISCRYTCALAGVRCAPTSSCGQCRNRQLLHGISRNEVQK